MGKTNNNLGAALETVSESESTAVKTRTGRLLTEKLEDSNPLYMSSNCEVAEMLVGSIK